MKGILIDPFACTVEEVEHDGDYRNIYTLLTHETMKVTTFEAVYPAWFAGRDALFVDEEGLLKDCDRFFVIAGNRQPLAGKGLVLGADDEGDTTAALTPTQAIRARVMFLEVTEGGALLVAEKPWQPPVDGTT